MALSLIPQIILVKWLGHSPELVEKYYSEGIYPVLSKFFRLLTGWVPVSVGDLMYTLAGFALLRYFYLYGRNIWRKPKTFLADAGATLSIAYFIFHLFWGMNYYRIPIEDKLKFSAEYTKEDLINFTLKITETTNRLHLELVGDSTKPVKIPYSTKEIYQKTLASYEQASKIFPMFDYERPSIKSSLYSLPLTYMGYGGYLNPFTNEAQVNSYVPAVRLPTISCHEIGHQLGYSSESSTNFIGLLVTSINPDPYFKYAAQSHGLAYCLSDLRKKDEKAFNSVYAQLNVGVKKNYQELQDFWNQYENPTEPLFKAMFNAFLKANNQEEGIESYNAVVGLLIGFDKVY